MRRDAHTAIPVAPDASDRPEQRRPYVWLLGLLVGAFFLRLPYLSQSLWYDELFYTAVGLSGESGRWVLTQDLHPPLYASILWLWIHVFGDSEVAVRLPSLLCGVASVAVVFALARRWFDTRIAFLAAGLMALSPAHIWYSQENKTNMLMLLLTACLVWQAERAWRSNRGRDWSLFAVVAVLAPWTNVFAIWILVAVFVWLWAGIVQRRGRDRWRPVAIVTGIAACPFLPLFFFALRRFETLQPSYLRPFTPSEAYKLLFIYLSHGNTVRTISPYASLDVLLQQPWPLFLVDGLFAALLIGGLMVSLNSCAAGQRRAPADWSRPLLLLYFTIPLVGVFVASRMNPRIYIERSMLILLPPYVILLAAAVFAISRRMLLNLLLIVLLALNGWALFNLWVAKADRWTVYKQKNDWRSTAQYFNGERQDSTTPLVIVGTNVPLSVLVYYDHRMREIADPNATLARDADAWIFYLGQRDPAVLVQVLRHAKADTFYVVDDTYWSGGTKQLLERVRADADFRPLDNRSFKGVSVFKFRWLRAAPGRQEVP
ncbi:MAG: rane protein-like protein [Deltaproteobacteria bacterium]|nr:rane protein-like protein [Deltaproteobacteria bacterium]